MHDCVDFGREGVLVCFGVRFVLKVKVGRVHSLVIILLGSDKGQVNFTAWGGGFSVEMNVAKEESTRASGD